MKLKVRKTPEIWTKSDIRVRAQYGRRQPMDKHLAVISNHNPFSSVLVYLLTRGNNTVRSESPCALRLRYVDLVVSIEVAVEMCCCVTVFSC
jgi:hypothetical protein